MKVLDLQCDRSHVFEAWFADEQAFQDQQASGMIECPQCSSSRITKKLSAPRLSLGAGRSPYSEVDAAADKEQGSVVSSAALAHWRAKARELVANTENVGDRFASEARAMHHGDLPPRAIRGVASAAQVKDLVADGVGVLALPPSLVEPLH